MVINRRGSIRVKAVLPIKLLPLEARVVSKTKNISLLGVSLELNEEIAPGSKMEVILELPSYKKGAGATEQINCEGVIVRCRALESAGPERHYDVGIFFRSFFKDGERRLSDYINYLISEEEQACQKYLKERNVKLEKRKKKKAHPKEEFTKKKSLD